MALNKVTYTNHQTVITAENLNDIQDEIIANAASISGIAPVKYGFAYGECSTAAATTAKTATITNYALVANSYVAIRFTNAVPASATLNINSLGAKAIYWRNSAITAGVISAGNTALFLYDGTYYRLISTDFDQTVINTTGFGVCDTAETTAAKVVSIPNFTLTTGATVKVQFTYANTATDATLNVNSTGARAIARHGLTSVNPIWRAGEVVELVYNGSFWVMIGHAFDDGWIDISSAFTYALSDGTGTAVVKYDRANKMVHGYVSVFDASSFGTSTNIFNIASGYRPAEGKEFPMIIKNPTGVSMYKGTVSSSGYIRQALTSTATDIYVAFDYIVG